MGDGNHVEADSANHDRRCGGVDRERVGVRGGRIGAAKTPGPPSRAGVLLEPWRREPRPAGSPEVEAWRGV